MNMKRHVIYMSDEEWAALHVEAARRGTTVSSLVRGTVNGTLGGTLNMQPVPAAAPISTTSVYPTVGNASSVQVTQADATDASHPARRPVAESEPQRAQAGRDALLHGINRGRTSGR